MNNYDEKRQFIMNVNKNYYNNRNL